MIQKHDKCLDNNKFINIIKVNLIRINKENG